MKWIGKIEWFDGRRVVGWAGCLPPPARAVELELVSNGRVIAVIEPSLFRWDLRERGFGEAACGFCHELPADLRDGGERELRVRFKATGVELENSPVRFATRDEDEYSPSGTVDLSGGPALVLAPHPDDEALGCGGAILRHRDRGDRVKVVFLTDGARGDMRCERAPADYVADREREARLAAAVAGVSDLEFWGQPDRSLSPAPDLEARMAAVLEAFRPDIVYAPSPFEPHPDHRAAAGILWRAATRVPHRFRIAFYEIGRPLAANALVDVTSVIDRKRAMCGAYASQSAHRPYGDLALALNRYRALTPGPPCTHAEGYLLTDSDAAGRQPLEALVLDSVQPRRTATPDRPLVSVVVRTRDRKPLLREALSSVVMQTYRPLEVVVVNDGGVDVTDMLAAFEPYLPVRHIRHEQPRGRSAAANAGVRASRGVYVNLLDDDDVLYPGHVSALAGYLEATGRDFVYGDCERGEYEWRDGSFALRGSRRPFDGGDFDRDRLYHNNYIPVMTALFRRTLFDAAGGFDEGFDALEDWDLWLRMAQRTTLYRIPGPTAEYRFHGEHDYDNRYWTLKLYDKHRDYWTPERLARTAWPRIAALKAEAEVLRKGGGLPEPGTARSPGSESPGELRRRLDEIESTYAWRLSRAVSRVFPHAFLRKLHAFCDRVAGRSADASRQPSHKPRM